MNALTLNCRLPLCLLSLLFTAPAMAQPVPDPPAQTPPSPGFEIARVRRMPNLPSPFQMIDWRARGDNYLQLILDFNRKGDLLPIVRWQDSTRATFNLPSYLGGDGPEGINCMAAVVSGALLGHDMTRYRGHNWVKLSQAYFSREDGVYNNNLNSRGSGSFWYDLLPNILFYQLADRYPDAGDTKRQWNSVAEQWYRASVALGGKTEPYTLPNFDHTGFMFPTMKPIDNKMWIEPDSAAAIAWLEYMAYSRKKDPRYLTAADWGVQALLKHPREKNPLYEVLLPYGALTAARLNAEQNRKYNVTQLLDWCFEAGDQRSARWGWGVLATKFGKYDCHGLAGSVMDTDGYAFAMDTYQWAGALTPIARYDPRYACDLGKWMLNLANAARFFYPDALPHSQQDSRSWSDRNDPKYCLGYEGVRNMARHFERAAADFQHISGKLLPETGRKNRKPGPTMALETETKDRAERLEHLWVITTPPGKQHWLDVEGRCEPIQAGTAAGGVQFSWANQPEGPFQDALLLNERGNTYKGTELHNPAGKIYVKAVATVGTAPERLHLNLLRITAQDPTVTPFATGDALAGGLPSNLCLYGSSHVGIMGALISRTNQPHILRLNLLATDYYHSAAYPTYLYYNPDTVMKTIRIDVGKQPQNLYDSVQHRFLKRRVQGITSFVIKPDSAVVVTIVPSQFPAKLIRGKLMVRDAVIDYQAR